MQLTRETVEHYKAKAPELLDSVTSGESEFIMKRDEKTDYCVQFDHGWCGIHKKYGAEFLGDACHFFPRATRGLGDRTLMTMALSCPESARMMLYESGALAYHDSDVARLPYSLKQFVPAELSSDAAFAIHETFVTAMGDETKTAERLMAMLSTMARALELQPVAQWEAAAGFYLRTAEGRMMPAEVAAADPFNLVNALQGLVGAARISDRPRLMAVIATMCTALGITLDWNSLTMQLHSDAAERTVKLLADWKRVSVSYQPILRRYLQAQLRLHLFPFAGLGNTLSERVTILGVRFATVRLALMCAASQAGKDLSAEEVVRVIQPLSRFMDHLADPTFSLKIYEETGWVREQRLRALVGDV
jgi:hypothetical protein